VTPQTAVNHYSPLRYPGGKGQLAGFFKKLLRGNGLCGGQYAEPYAGGAGVGLALLMTEHTSHIHLNDSSFPLYCFWRSVIESPEDFCRRVVDTPVTPRVWQEQKRLLARPGDRDYIDIGFAFFFLNRTSRSGVLNGGMIGGKEQHGPWKIDARFGKPGLIRRIERISDYAGRISLYNMDAQRFLVEVVPVLPAKTLLYLDPPYFEKGQRLYDNSYGPGDHSAIAELLQTHVSHPWIVTYDDCEQIRALYANRRGLAYVLNYSAQSHRVGREVMFLADCLRLSEAAPGLSALAPAGRARVPLL